MVSVIRVLLIRDENLKSCDWRGMNLNSKVKRSKNPLSSRKLLLSSQLIYSNFLLVIETSPQSSEITSSSLPTSRENQKSIPASRCSSPSSVFKLKCLFFASFIPFFLLEADSRWWQNFVAVFPIQGEPHKHSLSRDLIAHANKSFEFKAPKRRALLCRIAGKILFPSSGINYLPY